MDKHNQASIAALSRNVYESILVQSLNDPDFFSQIAALIDTDPYFMPGHLEMLWRAEECRDQYLQYRLHAYLDSLLRRILYSQSIRSNLSNVWTTSEHDALKEVVEYCCARQPAWSVLKYMYRFLPGLITPKVERGTHTPQHLVRKKQLDFLPLQAELQKITPYWWQVDTARQEYVLHHQHTWSLTLRKRNEGQTLFEKIDGNHESTPTLVADWYPVIHNTVLSLAEEMRIGLGRVSIVMMKPWGQSYRHYDSEKHLIGRNRYHLVLSCGSNNILSSGLDTVTAAPGEVWFFDNKVMHLAHNKSAQPRYHVIFDGYPLENLK